MAPIRIGFIGLSASASGSDWATTAHLPYLRQTSKYSIVALCNSSLSAAQDAINKHGLPASTKAYGSPEDLANDPNVDCVVCCVRVDKHYGVILPAVKAGKDVFCEWPLGSNLEQARELAELTEQRGGRTVVGLQARVSPIVRKVKETVEGGRIGKVLSTTFVGSAWNFGFEPTVIWLKYATEKQVGGNMATIHFGHTIDPMLYALDGELQSFNSILGNQRPEVQLLDKASGKVVETVTKDTPDQILIQGRLTNGVLLSYHLRGGKGFGGNQGLLWRIYGEKGEIQVTATGSLLNFGYEDAEIKLHDFASDKTETIQVNEDEFNTLPLPAQNIARLYEAFADGQNAEYPDWKAAVVRHALIDEMFKREEAGKQTSESEYLRTT